MTRKGILMVLALALAVGVVCVSAAEAQQRERSGRGVGSRNSLLGLLGRDQVQNEMKLTEEEKAKVNEVVEKLRGEMREQFQALEQIENRDERREKLSLVSDELDEKLRQQLRDAVPREKMMRLYQIRLHLRPVAESLASRFVAGRLELTEDQKAKLAEIQKDMRAKQTELFGKIRDASDDERSGLYQKMRELADDADEKALAVLTEDQKKAFAEMKGEKFELQMERGRRGNR